jgi:hypothetical protein
LNSDFGFKKNESRPWASVLEGFARKSRFSGINLYQRAMLISDL